ncbi:M50 family peptidase [Sulfolobus acidocaldarius]|uniref:Peptidase family M50 protein n=4 Tax=Sulfolobus acidocaldarius TaxID=2285 RepID=Q4JBH7_SULAC|nr:M50 family peptidase [Sulfolobus acidocaldarius]AHC50927.1 peptidase M50 [Sulfolobus acidocaldarius SUSAZ]AAY79852.1 peptidase family M50 protein [Sulfolobus acidocaldarius DSM 639]AGE70413.1 M50 family peptidase [Sulfolobus acidocaldarius N8]AGE72687.1 M50 family peptidase [Sulfolobus acidocaldarius Ron12/I]ALU29199.1 peptidase M50 [Sulfolobus acidocaldarius]
MSNLLNELEWRFRNLNEGLAFLLAILSIAIAYIRPYSLTYDPLVYLVFPIVTATIAIVPHEIAHRQIARRYGSYSRFALSFTGFLITLLVNLISAFGISPFVIFASGYTLILGRFGVPTQEVEGKISFGGPAVNLAVSIVSFIIAGFTSNPLVYIFFAELYSFNAWVAFFNLLPIPPLDGFKVFRWNKTLWIIGLIVSLALVIL